MKTKGSPCETEREEEIVEKSHASLPLHCVSVLCVVYLTCIVGQFPIATIR